MEHLRTQVSTPRSPSGAGAWPPHSFPADFLYEASAPLPLLSALSGNHHNSQSLLSKELNLDLQEGGRSPLISTRHVLFHSMVYETVLD